MISREIMIIIWGRFYFFYFIEKNRTVPFLRGGQPQLHALRLTSAVYVIAGGAWQSHLLF